MNKYKLYFYDIERFLKIKQQNISIAEWLFGKGFRNVAIYGMGDIGQCLYSELENTCLNVSYTIDRDKGNIRNVRVLDFHDEWEKVDLIVVTVPNFYEEIRETIIKKCDYKVVSIEEILYGIPLQGYDY